MFSPIQILHQLPFLRLVLFLIVGIWLASIGIDVNIGFILIFITLIISFIYTFLPPNKSYIKGVIIFLSITCLGYFCATIENPLKNNKSVVKIYAEKINNKTAEILTNHLNSHSSALCTALCIANKSKLSRSTKNDFSRAGASHILAVSGMHVGIIYTAISTLLGLISKRKNYVHISNIATIIFLWIYAFICGLQPSIVRACTMFSIPTISKLINRDNSSLNSLLFTAFCMIIYDYTYIFNIGFQLSFLAVAGILLFQEKIFNILKLQNKILIWIWSLTSVSIAAQITTLPLTIFYFHNIPILSLVSNLFVVPLATLLIYSTGILLILNQTPINNVIVLIINKLSYWLYYFIEYISNITYATIENIYISVFQTILLYLIILISKFFLESKKPICIIWILSLIVLFLGYDIIRLLML